MGEVLQAFDTDLQRHVAVKFMQHQASGSTFARQRFLEEARILAQLHHPNVVEVYEKGEIDGQPYFVMAYLDGHTLAERRNEFRTSAARAVGVVAEIAGGVQHAHDHGVYHRDLKAANVVFDGGRPVITDFGCARWDDGEISTHGFALLGTPTHMAPEVFEHGSKGHDARADLWALGVMLYQLLSGELPFADPRNDANRERLLTEDPEPIRTHPTAVPGVDDRLEAIVAKALAKNPADRYQTATELADELRGWLAVGPTATALRSEAKPPPRMLQRWWLLAGLAASAIVIAAIVFTKGLNRPKADPELTAAIAPRLAQAGDSVTFIDEKGLSLEPFAPIDGFVGTVTPANNGAFEVGAVYLHCIKLFDEAFPFPVRFEAEVAIGMTQAQPRVGLFAGEKPHSQPSGQTTHYAFAVAFGPGERGPAGSPPREDRVLSSAIRFAAPEASPLADLQTMLVPLNGLWLPHIPADLNGENSPGPLHKLIIDITPQGFSGLRDGRLLAEAYRAGLDDRISALAALETRRLNGAPLGNGGGLFVSGGAGRFRNVRLTRLP
jgi:hypothetical protein